MTQVDFYVLPRDGTLPVVNAVGRIAEKALSRGHRIFVSVCDEDQAHTFDGALWTFRPETFLPHALMGGDSNEPVIIGWSEPPLEQNDVLINTTGVILDYFSRFTRLAEIVAPDEACLASSRNAWRFYRDRGYSLTKHDL
ncbi:DNA polymerase III subunit chi [Luminiphilus sp.]|jgi:DNA polymerase-3 subunit chi|nr:DNA polymerase III subunit chi [Luminiphilus sp.]